MIHKNFLGYILALIGCNERADALVKVSTEYPIIEIEPPVPFSHVKLVLKERILPGWQGLG